MPYNTITCQRRAQTFWLTLNRPRSGNSIDATLANEICDACCNINQDDEIRVVIIIGAGSVFCSGIELEELSSLAKGDLKSASPASLCSRAIASINCPVIAAINGDALGAGLEIALACDIRIASMKSRFGFPETFYGLIPNGGGTQRLPRIVGKAKAMEMILLADTIDAKEAYRIGLVTQLVPKEKLPKEVDGMANKLTSLAPIAVKYSKEAINKGIDMTMEQGLRLEADLSILLHTTADKAEGINSFIEKRAAQFKGE